MKKKIYEITYNEEHHRMVVERCETGKFDFTLLWRGAPLKRRIPSVVRFYVNARKASKTDYVPNTLSWPICSQRFIDLLLPVAGADFELFDAHLLDVRSKIPVRGFKIMNVVRLVECLDLERSIMAKRIACAIVPVFKASKIPRTIHIFRAAESPAGIMFSQEAVEQLIGKGLRGVAFVTHETSQCHRSRF